MRFRVLPHLTPESSTFMDCCQLFLVIAFQLVNGGVSRIIGMENLALICFLNITFNTRVSITFWIVSFQIRISVVAENVIRNPRSGTYAFRWFFMVNQKYSRFDTSKMTNYLRRCIDSLDLKIIVLCIYFLHLLSYITAQGIFVRGDLKKQLTDIEKCGFCSNGNPSY